MNEAPSVSDNEDDDDFYDNDIIFDVIINKAENTGTQADAEEAVEDKEVNNNNEFFEDGNKINEKEVNTPNLQRLTRVRHRPNNLIPNISDRRVPYE